MIASIQGYQIDRVAVVDDDPKGRNTYKLAIEDMDSTPILEDGPLAILDQYAPDLQKRANAAFCDYHLKKHGNYASFNGDELASRLYQLNIPVVLCTRYTDWEASLLRRCRRNIPRVISYEEADPEVILHAFEMCISEFKGDFAVTRRPWRTLVRFEEFDDDCDYCYVVVPGWDAQKRIRLQNSDCPDSIVQQAKSGQSRCHAKVNLGAEADEDLYFTEWEA